MPRMVGWMNGWKEGRKVGSLRSAFTWVAGWWVTRGWPNQPSWAAGEEKGNASYSEIQEHQIQ